MTLLSSAALLLVLGGWIPGAMAYEQATHAILTQHAFAASVFGGGGPVDPTTQSLGLESFAVFNDVNNYFEPALSWTYLPLARTTQDYEKRMIKPLDVDPTTSKLAIWLMYGAIREDDNPNEDPPTPQDVAPGLRRPLHHFYDPLFDRPLTYPGLFVIEGDVRKNPDWAIGSMDSFHDSDTPEFRRRNTFSVFDAREAMFRALTLMSYDGSGYSDLAGSLDTASSERTRQTYWATTFRALGDILHLNQDMAQPQHTRNEPHSGKFCPTVKVCLTGHTSVYEKYIDARALGKKSFNTRKPFSTTVPLSAQALQIDSYPIPAFANYTDYWSTAPGNQFVQGKGLADYSNRGFFTAAKNLDSMEYPFPSHFTSDYTIRSFTPTKWDGSAPSDPTPVHVYYGAVDDAWQQSTATDVPLTTFSVWDQFLTTSTGTPAYSLNRVNYDAMAALLLPRAVAYSAGLINFFFRGRIDIELPDEGVFAVADHGNDEGFTTLRAKLRNATADFVDPQGSPQPQHMSDGQFFAVIRYHKDKQYVATLDTVVGTAPCVDPLVVVDVGQPNASTNCRDGVEQIIVSRPVYAVSLDQGEEKVVDFDFADAHIPYGMTDVTLQIVYRGELGSEADAVAVGTLDLSEPTYFTYQNASDYIHLDGHVYTRGQVDSDPGLLALVRPTYCVDWRQTPPHLLDLCLNQFDIDLKVAFDDLDKPLAEVTGLPNRRFVRLVYLTVADEGLNPAVAARATTPIKLATRRHDGDGDLKAFLLQDTTCLPDDPIAIAPRHAQVRVSSGTVTSFVEPLKQLRGVNGWRTASCVVGGDDSIPGSPDDRASVMTPLVPNTPEVQPYPVTIMPDYL